MTDKLILKPSHRRHAVALLILWFAGGSPHAAPQPAPSALPIPSSLFGTWEVTAVHVDTGATRTPLYRPGDFRLIGRIFRFTSGSITSNTPERQDCPSPGIGKSLPAAKLIESSMAGRAVPPVLPTAEDYRLQLPSDPKVSAFTVNCNGKLWGASLGREDGNRGAWLLPLASGKLALRWYGETILELGRLPEGARPSPSFDCSQASIGAEKAICRSIPLAKLDVSLARSFAAAAQEFREAGRGSSLAALKAQQRAWLLQRNRCGSDVACLERSMSARLETIETMPGDE